MFIGDEVSVYASIEAGGNERFLQLFNSHYDRRNSHFRPAALTGASVALSASALHFFQIGLSLSHAIGLVIFYTALGGCASGLASDVMFFVDKHQDNMERKIRDEFGDRLTYGNERFDAGLIREHI